MKNDLAKVLQQHDLANNEAGRSTMTLLVLLDIAESLRKLTVVINNK